MYIITGGAGFIGSAMIWELNRHKIYDILIVDHLGEGDKWKNLVGLRYKDYIHKDDFLRYIHSKDAPKTVEAVIHFGACSSTTEHDADYLMKNNVQYSKSVCHYALNIGARYIHASSAATYGDGKEGFSNNLLNLFRLKPLNMYGYSKHLFDLWAFRENLLNSIVCLKFFNVYGPNEYHKNDMRSMVCKAVEQIRSTGSLRLFRSYTDEYVDGGQMRDFIYVKDCVNAIWQLLQRNDINGILNMGSGTARSWNDLARAVFKALNLKEQIEYIDMPENLRGKYQDYTKADMSWIKNYDFQISLHSLEDGVRDYVCNYLIANNQYLSQAFDDECLKN